MPRKHSSFSSPSQNQNMLITRMNGQPITSVESAKLLGVTIDRRLTFGEHIDKVCSNMDSRLYGMRALKRLGLNRKGLITYYTANIRSALTYACPVWSSLISDNLMDKVVQVERKALKVIYPDLSYDAAICECGMPPIELFMQDQCSKLILRIRKQDTHPLNKLSIRKESRSTRVSSDVHMPVCRTTKLQNIFFYNFSKVL